MIVRKKEESNSIEELKRQKLQLEIRKLQLEVWEKERSLGVVHSKLTSDAVAEIKKLQSSSVVNYSNAVIDADVSLEDEEHIVIIQE